jgi:hypothetical protein
MSPCPLFLLQIRRAMNVIHKICRLVQPRHCFAAVNHIKRYTIRWCFCEYASYDEFVDTKERFLTPVVRQVEALQEIEDASEEYDIGEWCH